MNLSSAWAVLTIARESSAAVDAARAALAAGQPIAAAIDAFAAATDTPMDDAVVAELHRGAAAALAGLRTAAEATVALAAWLEAHGEAVDAGSTWVAEVAQALPGLLATASRAVVTAGATATKASVRLAQWGGV